MSGEAVRLSVDGQEFTVRARPDEPGVYDFDWTNGPAGQGFSSATSDGSPMSPDELRAAVRNYIETYDPGD
ncbi:hypothetical protein [Streptomyces sp. I05A-00742]|uniref:hypothetical protein n=1 Tax=Streptomyces sp. I05A-00742 TaxID=2732853 RepID=UPI0014885CDB|nr:hypothetical protein [Streptomyces sp. I05A-00742]